MPAIQMTIDDDLVKKVDAIANVLHTTRSAFTRDALKEAIRQHHIHQLEERHRKAYELQPAKREEFGVWEDEQDWGGE